MLYFVLLSLDDSDVGIYDTIPIAIQTRTRQC